MAGKKILIELEVSENFKPCEKQTDVFNQDCPFSYWDSDDGCIWCGYDLKDCPMRNIKTVD